MTYQVHCRWLMLVSGLLLGLVLWPPTTAHADAPFHDPEFVVPQGGGPTTTTAATGDPVQSAPPAVPVLTPPLIPMTDDDPGGEGGGRNPNDPLHWLDLAFNPGKWLLDSVLGSLAAVINTLAGLCQALALWSLGLETPTPQVTTAQMVPTAFPVLPPGSDDPDWNPLTSDGHMFYTPRQYTLDRSTVQQVRQLVFQACIPLLILIGGLRGLRLLADPQPSAVIQFLFTVLGGCILTAGAGIICGLLIDGANALSHTIQTNLFPGALGMETFVRAIIVGQGGVVLTSAIASLLYWGALFRLGLRSFVRLTMVNLLLILAPLAGVAHASGMWNYARVWFFRLLELLLTPVIWVLILGFTQGLVTDAIQGDEAILSMCMAAYLFWQIPHLTTQVGLAAKESVIMLKGHASGKGTS